MPQAFPHNTSVLLNQACAYTFVWNLLNMPVGVLPVSTVRADEQYYGNVRYKLTGKLVYIFRSPYDGFWSVPVCIVNG